MSKNTRFKNRLASETSPYLLQHQHNPVDWYPWGEEAFEAAKRRDLPIFLSSGYSSCHWCHVMAHESFEDEHIAGILNEHYICIKIDREERPDVDQFYMEACTALNGQGGWPLSVFLNHDKTPFFAGTYFPKEDRYGSIGFHSLLERISELWEHKREQVTTAGQEIVSHIQNAQSAMPDNRHENLAEKAYEQFAGNFDPVYGGFHGAPKFPSVHNLLFLLRYGRLAPDSKSTQMVETTLNAMAQGGIFDHIGGGFFRYSTDQQWLVPHFEKMLYDNAMMILIYGEATAAINPRFKTIAERTVSYVFREMRDKDGAFYTAQDADAAGEEGSTYLWTRQEILELLGETDAVRFCEEFDITEDGNFEGKNIPNRIGKEKASLDETFAEHCFGQLLNKRDQREQPMKDDKILVSSNGLMIAALASAGRYLNRPDWIQAAQKAAEFIQEKMVYSDRLMTGWRDGEVKHKATLDDYAYFIWGLLELYHSTFDAAWLGQAMIWSERMQELFGDEYGGFYLTGKDVTDLPFRQKVFADSALPSGNAVAVTDLIRLAAFCDREDLKKHALRTIHDVSGLIGQVCIGYSGFLQAQLLLENESEVTVSMGAGQEEFEQVLKGYLPFVSPVVYKQDYEILSSRTEDKKSLDGKATAYLCDKKGCRPPMNDVKKLVKILEKVNP
jgi:uncharacterized protein YyaL (SSP411 family)